MTSLLKAAALALAATCFVAPVHAQVPGEFNYYDDDIDDYNPCMGQRSVRNHFADLGYSNIKLNSPMGSFYQVKANKDGHTWLIRFNTCNQQIRQRQQLQ